MAYQYHEEQFNSAWDLLQAAWLPNWRLFVPSLPRSAGPAVRFVAAAWMPNYQALLPHGLESEMLSKMKPALQLIANAWTPNFKALSPAKGFEMSPAQRLFLSAWLPDNEALMTAFGLLLAVVSVCKLGADSR
jgi:hypothetical protein